MLRDFNIVTTPNVPDHPMWSKMWQRAGQDPTEARRHVVHVGQPISPSKPIIALGESALRYLTGQSDLIRWRGRQLQTQAGHIIYPTLEPHRMLPWQVDEDDDEDDGSDLNRSPARFQGVWVWDVHQAFRQGLRLRPQPPTSGYAVDPPRDAWRRWLQDLLIGPRLSFDIETAYKMSKMDDEEWEAQGLTHGQMLRISFCAQPGLSVSVAWTQEYMDGIKELLASEQDKVGWNAALFDVPRLEAEQIHVNGRMLDYQDAWHIVQSDLPKGLEWVSSFYTAFHPWKHLSQANPGLYSCIDADAALQNAEGIDQALTDNNQTHLFDRHVTQLMPILKAAGVRGNAIDLGYSHELEAEMMKIKERVERDVQPLIPHELKPRKRYKREPEEVTATITGTPQELRDTGVTTTSGRVFEPVTVMDEVKTCSHCGQRVSSWAEHMKGRAKGTKKDPDTYNRCKAAGAQPTFVPGLVTEWDEILAWNPNSSDQIKDYVRYYGHPMGKNRKTDADSISGKHLDKLIRQHGAKFPLYKMLKEYKQVAKTISTYIYHNYVDVNGLIHSSYVNAPSTWRLAGRNVNLTNVGKRESNPWTVRARRQIVARPGHIFVDADSTSIEAVIVGYLINDPAFLAMAGKSIHAWLCCQELGWVFNNETMELVKSKHKDLYNKMKTAIYLLLYGGDPYLMYMENPETFPTIKSARETQDKIFALIPKLKDWQEQTRERAKKEGVIKSLWGYRHYFYDVYTFKRTKDGKIEYKDDGSPKIKLGKDGKRSLAFEPQNTAASFGRDTLLLLGQSKWQPYLPANVFIHDGYTLEVPLGMEWEAEQFLVDTLTRPVAELGGLRIGCETGMGLNWAPEDPDKKFWPDGNPDGMKTIRKVEV